MISADQVLRRQSRPHRRLGINCSTHTDTVPPHNTRREHPTSDFFNTLLEQTAEPGRAQDFIDSFEAWDHSDENIVHTTPGIVHEGVLYQSEDDPKRFYLIGTWNNRENHRNVVTRLIEQRPAWMDMLTADIVPEYCATIG
ncbi:MAG: hypothetical protein F4017_01200 [Acidimicrobiaceae bacterium]|nr:hypothetical protein [Acidimicrobiaceae bacterium]MYK73200.1 hypothetical protein [Acidimicrobiaceae bacterium]